MRWLLLTTALLSACSTLPPTERTPFLPAGEFGILGDNDVGALNFSAWAFAAPANTRDNPVDAVRAAIALEYLPGELRENPRWIGMDPGVNANMAAARDQLRQVLGIRPDAPPQAVVNTLLALSANLEDGNQPAVAALLNTPIFILPPEQTLRVLTNLPYIAKANFATASAVSQMYPGGGRG